jgi:hypothetical protein
MQRLLDSGEGEFLAMYGRRRVGKTFLIREYFEPRSRYFEMIGERDASLGDQLQNFMRVFERSFGSLRAKDTPPETWRAALQLLASAVDRKWKGKKPIVLFFDELPWLASRKSRFMEALDHFWNSWGSRKSNLVLVVCGSASSWMIKKLINAKGGLHNRVTEQIALMPFTLAETEEFLQAGRVNLVRKDVLELYMAFGGVPYYLRALRRGDSVATAIDRLCFAPGAPFAEEFDRLFASLFSGSEAHVAVVRALAGKRCGVTRIELSKSAGLPSGGGLTRVLDELEKSGFVRQEAPFGKKERGALYRLIDEFSLFHLNWIEGVSGARDGYWSAQQSSRRWSAWAGFTFEGICLKHVAELKRALGIAGVNTSQSGWRAHGAAAGEGAQVDLVIDRADNVINLCEMKFALGEFTVTKAYADALAAKAMRFRNATKTRKNLHTTLVTTHGAKRNAHYEANIDSELAMEALFGG